MLNSIACILFAIFAVSISVERKRIAAESISVECEDCPGGWNDVDPCSPEIRNYAEKCLELYGNKALVLKAVFSAKTQVVAGINYNLTVQVGVHDCTQEDEDAGKRCPVNQTEICHFQLWVRPWIKRYELMSASCGDLKSI